MKLLNIPNIQYQISFLQFLILIRYADIINTMWLTFLYAPLIPIVLPMSMINIILYYWIEKYTIMRRSTAKDILSKNISQEMIEHIELIIIFYTIGNLFNLINRQFSIWMENFGEIWYIITHIIRFWSYLLFTTYGIYKWEYMVN